MEYWFASVRAEVFNGSHKKPRKTSEFMRDMLKGILEQLTPTPSLEDIPRDKLIEIIKRDLGIK